MRTELASASYDWELDKYKLAVCVEGRNISGFIAGKKVLDAQDSEYVVGNGAVLLDGSVTMISLTLPLSLHTPLEW